LQKSQVSVEPFERIPNDHEFETVEACVDAQAPHTAMRIHQAAIARSRAASEVWSVGADRQRHRKANRQVYPREAQPAFVQAHVATFELFAGFFRPEPRTRGAVGNGQPQIGG
jgi:hypothetical protein